MTASKGRSRSSSAKNIFLPRQNALSWPPWSLGIKWPNDVLLDGRKLAGVLVEVVPQDWIVVGVGVNTNCCLREAPEELRQRAVSLADLTGRRVEHRQFLLEWLEAFSFPNGRTSGAAYTSGRGSPLPCACTGTSPARVDGSGGRGGDLSRNCPGRRPAGGMCREASANPIRGTSPHDGPGAATRTADPAQGHPASRDRTGITKGP